MALSVDDAAAAAAGLASLFKTAFKYSANDIVLRFVGKETRQLCARKCGKKTRKDWLGHECS